MGEIEVAEVSASELDALLVVHRAVEAEREPDDPPIVREELAADLFSTPSHNVKRIWLATLDGDPAGALTLELPQSANLDHVYVDASVAPTGRRRGVATALLAAGLHAVADERKIAAAWVEPGPGVGLCEWLGLDLRQTERVSRLRVADLDLEQLRRWVDEAPARDAGYRVVTWQGLCPDEHLDALCAARSAMVDAPLDDFEYETRYTTEEIREEELAATESGYEFGALALGPDGSAAGMTMLWVSRYRPSLAYQGDTAVVAAHRGHRLGRWLKAANLSQGLSAWPGVEVVETDNAESNPWMLAINVDMGFAPHKTHLAYQGPLATALSRLSSPATSRS